MNRAVAAEKKQQWLKQATEPSMFSSDDEGGESTELSSVVQRQPVETIIISSEVAAALSKTTSVVVNLNSGECGAGREYADGSGSGDELLLLGECRSSSSSFRPPTTHKLCGCGKQG